MRKAPAYLVVLTLLYAVGCARNSGSQSAVAQPREQVTAGESVRPPAVAGQFYTDDPTRLAEQVKAFIEAAETPHISGDIIGLIAPHAGYEYSGAVAGYSYAALEGRSYSTVILVGPSHRGIPLAGAALSSRAFWQTPLGKVAVNQDVTDKLLAANTSIKLSDLAHAQEHSLEVQLPFLQTVLDDFSIVPIVLSDFGRHNTLALAEAIASVADEETLLVASTDLSHYPVAESASEVDHIILDAIATLDVDKVYAGDAEQLARGIDNLHCTCCGLGAVVAVMQAAKFLGATEAKVLHYANSADVEPRSANRCVGYGSVLFSGARKPAGDITGAAATPPTELNEPQQQYLLTLARDTIETFLNQGAVPEIATDDPAMHNKRAVFVTLSKNGNLRGCIGQIVARDPLAAAVREAAVSAAVRDQRFSPVVPGELPNIHIEISVLSPFMPVASYEQVEVGKHGVLIKCGRRSGVFLPQVAPEQGWDRTEMLENLCAHKASLPKDAYKDPETELYVFTAQVFGEEEHH
jgi:MEMO1 family protein